MPPYIPNPRRTPRVPARLRVELAHAGETWQAETGDLGAGGCLLVSPRPLVARAPLRLVLRAEVLADPLSVGGSVAWTREVRGGVAFDGGRSAPGADPAAWFRRLVAADRNLASALVPVPAELDHEAPLYLLPAPRRFVELAPDEVALLRHADHGLPVQALLRRSGLPEPRATRALFGLFERRVVTLALGQAGEAWRWRAVLAESGYPAPPLATPLATPVPSAAPRLPPIVRVAPAPAPAAPPVLGPPPRLERTGSTPLPTPMPIALERPRPVAPPSSLLRGAHVSRRSPQAQERLDAARAHAGAGRVHEAIALLRQALSLAPRDPEISELLGRLAFKDRVLKK
ncbi:MAG TPA: PilZ domain-containing protein [Anaeromyxobacteraceae bacterium]|nr:PilZ domain-containing protein [Anaeromyxobacteraceae bacterium]